MEKFIIWIVIFVRYYDIIYLFEYGFFLEEVNL